MGVGSPISLAEMRMMKNYRCSTCLDDFSDATLNVTKAGSSLLYTPLPSLTFKIQKSDGNIFSKKTTN